MSRQMGLKQVCFPTANCLASQCPAKVGEKCFYVSNGQIKSYSRTTTITTRTSPLQVLMLKIDILEEENLLLCPISPPFINPHWIENIFIWEAQQSWTLQSNLGDFKVMKLHIVRFQFQMSFYLGGKLVSSDSEPCSIDKRSK